MKLLLKHRFIFLSITIFLLLYLVLNYLFETNQLLKILQKPGFTKNEYIAINIFKIILNCLLVFCFFLFCIFQYYKDFFRENILKKISYFFYEKIFFSLIVLAVISIVLIIVIKFFFIFDNEDPLRHLGLNNFRATHWLINYYDLGFVKRGLLGTLLKSFFSSSYTKFNFILIGSFLIQILVIISYLKLCSLVLKNKTSEYLNILLLFFISSPSFIFFYFSDNGRTDQLNNLLMLISIILVIYSRNYKNIVIVSIFCSIGILNHESFIAIQFPIVLSVIFLFLCKVEKNIFSFNKIKLIVPIVVNFIVVLCLVFFGYIKPNILTVTEIYEIIGKQADFETRIIGTFDRLPWQDFSLPSYEKSPESFIFTSLSFFISNAPFFLIAFFIWIKFYFINYRKINLSLSILIFSCFLPVILSQIMTFNDDYRVHASFALNLQIATMLLIFFRFNSAIYDKINLKKTTYTFLCLAGVFFNLVLIIFYCLTITVSSDISPISYLLYKMFL